MADEYTHKLEEAVRAIVEAIRAPRPVNLNIANPVTRDCAAAASAKSAERVYGIYTRDERLRFAAANYQVDPNGGLSLPGIAYFAPGEWRYIVCEQEHATDS